MSADHLLCITETGGIPLLIRSRPGVEPISFPVVGTLNGLHMFGINKDVMMKSTTSTTSILVWKKFSHANIVIIAIGSKQGKNNWTEGSMFDLVENVFNSIVLLLGIEGFKNLNKSSVELKIKRNIKVCFNLLDSFLKNEYVHYFGLETKTMDCVISSNLKILSESLTAFVEASQSQYGCLLKNCKIVCATTNWWSLEGSELALINRLILTLNPTTIAHDIPVFLPMSNPSSALRFILFTLVESIQVCILCGPSPSMSELQQKTVERFWVPGFKLLLLTSLSPDIPSELMTSFEAKGLLGFFLVNKKLKRCLSSSTSIPLDTQLSKKNQVLKISERKKTKIVYSMLHDYLKVVNNLIAELTENDKETEGVSLTSHYEVISQCSFFWLVKEDFELFCCYKTDNCPTFTLKGFTVDILNHLISLFS